MTESSGIGGRRQPRVAVVSHGFFPRLGGAERYHRLTAKALSEEAEVEVFTAAARRSESLPATPRVAWVDGIRVHYLPWSALGGERFLRPWSLWADLRRFDPDLVWANHPSPSADVAAAYARRHQRPWVASYHADLSPERWRNRLYTRWEGRSLRRASAILVSTERTARSLAARGVDPRRITVTPAGPFLGDGHPPEPFGSRLGEDAAPGPERPYLFVGALDTNHAYKRLDRLIDAVARLRDDGVRVDVEVVGDGGTRTAFERMARRLGLSDRVRFLGRLGDLELAERYRTAWALVLPATSGSEGFGVVVGEAAWYGCPSVVSSAVASSEFWSALGVARIYDSQSPRGLEEALRTLWEGPRDRHALSHATPAVRDRLSWDHLLPETLTPIRSLLGSARIR